MGHRGLPFVRCNLTPGCVRHAGHRGVCKVRDGKVKPLTPRQEDVLVAVVNEGSIKAAAHSLGVGRYAIRDVLHRIHERLGARHTTHAAALMFRRLGDRYLVRG